MSYQVSAQENGSSIRKSYSKNEKVNLSKLQEKNLES